MSLLPETIRRLDEIIGDTQSRGRVPTLVAGVVRDGELVHVTGAGELPADLADTQYRIGSISKTFTAALVLRLRDEDRLALDDLLYRHLPGTPVGGVTLRQLLGHVSGLQREPEGEWWERSAGASVDALLAGLTPDKLAHPPHRAYHYSNLAYGLLGAVLTRITGEDWASLVGKRLLEPLGMARTTYQPVEPYARGYVVHPWYGTLNEEPRHDHAAMAPAGQLWSTVADLVRWAAFLADPAPAVLAPATVAEMYAPVVIGDPDSWSSGHGLGLELWRRGERVFVGHTGSMPGYLAVLAVHRPSRTGVVGFANAYTLRGSSVSTLGLDLLTAVLDREPAHPAPWRAQAVAAPASVQALCGRWWWMGREYAAACDASAGELVITPLSVPGATPWRFSEDGPDTWRGRSGMNDGELLRVRRDPDGTPATLDIATFIFTRTP
ncbi:MAG TPA: serine hydrolase domain-containing protein [Micromonosporaceae bacterium]|jgi:CubicO group peptidase (beta-lactamase class C family)|nr:serine hydrolase domain-containing protein [Micromonosporaceae bacterium]